MIGAWWLCLIVPVSVSLGMLFSAAMAGGYWDLDRHREDWRGKS